MLMYLYVQFIYIYMIRNIYIYCTNTHRVTHEDAQHAWEILYYQQEHPAGNRRFPRRVWTGTPGSLKWIVHCELSIYQQVVGASLRFWTQGKNSDNYQNQHLSWSCSVLELSRCSLAKTFLYTVVHSSLSYCQAWSAGLFNEKPSVGVWLADAYLTCWGIHTVDMAYSFLCDLGLL